MGEFLFQTIFFRHSVIIDRVRGDAETRGQIKKKFIKQK